MCESLPPDFEEWEHGIFTKLIFYKKLDRKTAIGHCECGAQVEIKPSRSGSIITCPSCGEQVRVTYSCGIHQQRFVTYISRLDDGWICRMFVSNKLSSFTNGRVSVSHFMTEEQRDWLGADSDSVISFHPVWGGDERWLKGRGRTHGMGYSGWKIDERQLDTYPHNLTRLFKGSGYEYSALDIACEHSRVSPLRYQLEYKHNPKLEMLYKLGLYMVAEQIMYEDWSHNARRIMENVKSLKDLGIYSADELKQCHRLKVEQLIARKEVKSWDIPETDISLAIDFVCNVNSRCGEDMKYSFITRQGWYKYYLTQRSEYSSIRNFVADYTDYIRDCITLELDINDTQISKPHSLKTAHQRTLAEVKIKWDKDKNQLIQNVYERLKDLVEWSNGKYCVIMPHSAEEIITEGKRQQHCVGGYCDRVAKGTSVIVFIRREEAKDDNFYTAEFLPNMTKLSIMQVRGQRNAPMTDDVRTFMSQYESWFNRRAQAKNVA
ncbi:MAG: PcfJ domain-containing protein [Clostridiales bacterium]|nr:PcfJ domain-containing protein [Clostridiales bacterium]